MNKVREYKVFCVHCALWLSFHIGFHCGKALLHFIQPAAEEIEEKLLSHKCDIIKKSGRGKNLCKRKIYG